MIPETIKIIENAFLIACDEAGTVGHFTVVVKNDRITSIVRSGVDVSRMYPKAERVDAGGKVMVPGLIDCHMHGESALLHVLTAGEPVEQWHRNPRYQAMDAFLRHDATVDDWIRLYRIAYYSALRSGITTLVEFGRSDADNAFAASVEAFRSTYVRGLLVIHNGDQMEASRRARSASLGFCLALPPAEELTTYNLQMAMRMGRDQNMPVVAHLAETDRDVEVIRKNFRKSYVQTLDEYHFFDGHVLPVHWSILERDDAEILRHASIRVAIAPLAAAAKGYPTPPTSILLDHEMRPVIGSDWGPARPWQSMRAVNNNLTADGAPALTADGMLRMCTLEAARYVGVEAELGSIAVGKKADLVLLRCAYPDIQGAFGEIEPSRIVEVVTQRVSESDVCDVMVNGEFYVRESNILTYAEEDLNNDVRTLLRKVPGVSDEPRPLVVPVLSATDPARSADGEAFEEGFRIVHRGTSSQTSGPVFSLKPTPPPAAGPAPEAPIHKKVFGEDED